LQDEMPDRLLGRDATARRFQAIRPQSTSAPLGNAPGEGIGRKASLTRPASVGAPLRSTIAAVVSATRPVRRGERAEAIDRPRSEPPLPWK